MGTKADELARRLRAFNDEIMDFVANCSEEDWRKRCPSEDWGVGVVARHLADGHYGIREVARKIVAGEDLPNLTMADIVENANRHARQHADCTRDEVLGLLTEDGRRLADFVSAMTDAQFGATGELALVGGPVSAGKLIELVVLASGGEHLAHMKSATGR